MAEQSLVCSDIIDYCTAILHTLYNIIAHVLLHTVHTYAALQSRANVFVYRCSFYIGGTSCYFVTDNRLNSACVLS